MKVALGSKFVDGPYGGGNTFIKNISAYLLENGHKVVFNLQDNDIDIILLTNPLYDSEHSTFTHLDISEYQLRVNDLAISIQRINECDERKQTNYVNNAIMKSNKNIDHTVFVSNWIRDLYKNIGLETNNSSVILGGSDQRIFNGENKVKWNGTEKIKLVTHHWSDNHMKGFKTYKLIDEMLDNKEWSNILSFTYIGNYPKELEFKNTRLIPPLEGDDLAKELKNQHIYITGSLNEPSGNHHVEASLCKLPVLYLKSGGVTEYCKDFGVEFTHESIEEKINYLMFNYENYYSRLSGYNLTSTNMSAEFVKLFETLHKSKLEIRDSRIGVNNYLLKFNKIYFRLNKFINKVTYKFRKWY